MKKPRFVIFSLLTVKLKNLTAPLIAFAMIGQNLAFAYDPVGYASISEQNRSALEWAAEKFNSRFEKFSLKKQERIVNQFLKRAEQAQDRLAHLSDQEWDQKTRKFMMSTPSSGPTERSEDSNAPVTLSPEEAESLNFDETSPALSTDLQNKSLAPQFTKTNASLLITQAIQKLQTMKNKYAKTGEKTLNRSPATDLECAFFTVILVILSVMLIATGLVFLFFVVNTAVTLFIAAGACLLIGAGINFLPAIFNL